MSYRESDHVISTGIKTNDTHEGLEENVVFLSYLEF